MAAECRVGTGLCPMMGAEGKSSAGEISPVSRMYDANFDDNENRWVYGPSAVLGVGTLLKCR